MADELFPIDIHYNKLLGEDLYIKPCYLKNYVCINRAVKGCESASICHTHMHTLPDWLIDRRHCESKWHAQLQEVREKLDGALKQLSDVKQLSWITEQPCT